MLCEKGILGDQEITTENGQILELELKPGERVSDVFNRIPVNNVVMRLIIAVFAWSCQTNCRR